LLSIVAVGERPRTTSGPQRNARLSVMTRRRHDGMQPLLAV
jgi:hypothetical protein